MPTTTEMTNASGIIDQPTDFAAACTSRITSGRLLMAGEPHFREESREGKTEVSAAGQSARDPPSIRHDDSTTVYTRKCGRLSGSWCVWPLSARRIRFRGAFGHGGRMMFMMQMPHAVHSGD